MLNTLIDILLHFAFLLLLSLIFSLPFMLAWNIGIVNSISFAERIGVIEGFFMVVLIQLVELFVRKRY